MRTIAILLASFILALVLTSPAAQANQGVKATVLTPVPKSANAGAELHIAWSLANEETGEPFSACAVFVRLTSPTGETSEAFAECGLEASKGNYNATPIVPIGGISEIEIGVAGTITDREGNSRRSDWLMPLTNDPIGD
ncbi:MAG: hypothetical protein QNJ11_13515 [Woeseiaceae bacterium]|nr:hypothetical protein [Woeseiaceae bacterium]